MSSGSSSSAGFRKKLSLPGLEQVKLERWMTGSTWNWVGLTNEGEIPFKSIFWSLLGLRWPQLITKWAAIPGSQGLSIWPPIWSLLVPCSGFLPSLRKKICLSSFFKKNTHALPSATSEVEGIWQNKRMTYPRVLQFDDLITHLKHGCHYTFGNKFMPLKVEEGL